MQAILDLNATAPTPNAKVSVNKPNASVNDAPKRDFRSALEQQTNPKSEVPTTDDQQDTAKASGLSGEEALNTSGPSPLLNDVHSAEVFRQLQQRLPQLATNSSVHPLSEPEGLLALELSVEDSELTDLVENGIAPILITVLPPAPLDSGHYVTGPLQAPQPDASVTALFANNAGAKLSGKALASETPFTAISVDENSNPGVYKPTLLAATTEPGRPLTAPLEVELSLDTKASKPTGTMAALLAANDSAANKMSAIDPRELVNSSTILGEGLPAEKDQQSALLQSMSGSSSTEIQNHANSRMQMPAVISFGKPQWAGMVAERTAMMAAQNIQSADIQMDPPELGPLHVRIHVQNDQVSVSFTSAHAPVREALDQTAMRLRELCEQQGMNLVDVDVSDQQAQQQAERDASSTRPSSSGLPTEGSTEDPLPEKIYTVSYGVDDFA